MTDKWIKRKHSSENEYTETHPSYGCISISQVYGRGMLFGSEVAHQHFLSLTISEARRVVDTPREFVMEERELIRIAMTQAQFAEMITSPNRGSGTPCTIERFTGDAGEPWFNSRHGGRPEPPAPEHYTKKYKNAMGYRADLVVKAIKDAKVAADAFVDGSEKVNKSTLKELQSRLQMALLNLEQNLPYVMNEMEEGIEKRMATAINEFESFVSFSLQAKGLENLTADVPRLDPIEQKALPDGEQESK